MHYTIDYSQLTEDQKKQKAIDNVKFWFGAKYNTMKKAFTAEVKAGMTFDSFEIAMGFCGVTGYPVKSFAEECGMDKSIIPLDYSLRLEP
jgi:hypothetical protein